MRPNRGTPSGTRPFFTGAFSGERVVMSSIARRMSRDSPRSLSIRRPFKSIFRFPIPGNVWSTSIFSKLVLSGRMVSSSSRSCGMFHCPVSQFKKTTPDRFPGRRLERGIKGPARRDNLKLRIEHDKRFPHGIDDILRDLAGPPDLDLHRFYCGDIGECDHHPVDHIL